MKKDENWLKFIITGNPKYYIQYSDSVKVEIGGVVNEIHNRCTCDKGNEYRG
ncbi:MAG: hypothetical protein MJ091_04805 [Clostridia bacterium]|nr:hypothetical protein [Clostridia bacterium]